MLHFTTFQPEHTDQIIELITHIQQKEFQVPVTIEDQPDLKMIDKFYQKDKGNFWVALWQEDENVAPKVVGTIALIDAGDGIGALRKMFLHKDFRGKYDIAQKLLDVLLDHAKENNINKIYLGTVEKLIAARRFYVRNGFELIAVEDLPPQFPRMPVDTMFYWCSL